MEKTFADGRKIAKFVKVFSLESFPLYGIIIMQVSAVEGCLLTVLLSAIINRMIDRIKTIIHDRF